MAMFSYFPEACTNSHANLNIFWINIDYLSSEPDTFVKLHLCNHIGHLTFEVIRGLPHNCKCVDLAKSLELKVMKISLSPTLRADQSWWEVI